MAPVVVGITTLISACGAQGPRPNERLLSELRQKHHDITGEAAQPRLEEPDASRRATRATPQTAQQTSVRQQHEEHGRRLDEVKLITPAMLERDYPYNHYLSGVGYTENIDLNQAILNAKEQVAAAISSAIESELTVKLSAGRETENGRMETRSSSSSAQTTKQIVTFEHAELIRVDPKRTGCDEERCVAVAFLERKTLAAEGLAEYQPLEERFQRAIKRALQSADRFDILGFSTHYKTLTNLYPKLSSLGFGLSAILTSESFKSWSELQTRWLKLQARRDELMSESPVIVDVSELSDQRLRPVLSEELGAQLNLLGAQTRPFFGGASPCVAQAQGALHLKVTGDVQEGSLSGIEIYTLPYQLSVTQCASGAIIAQFKQSLKFTAPTNRSFTEAAREKLQITRPSSSKELYKALSLTLPLTAPHE